ncbi:unnamed protein product [Angiostrongylus costaricensis]|uniref:Uncharacterized protein n=1 Tax=Angiostrongylus costaricensis TaxID=334426 RepID=A0A0R3PK13_ANGCS|nr:unnamed protein product [Angiostrongylus costaricensis]
MNHQPVVVNSLLCFIHNFRDNPQVRNLVAEYFPKTAIAEAKNILCSKVAEEASSPVPEDVFDLYDMLVTREEQMQFAATDLTILPLALLSKDEDKNEIMRELKTLRTFISDALDGRIEDSPQSRETPTPVVRCKLNTSASSPEFPVANAPTSVPCESPKPLLSSSLVNNVSQQSLQLALQRRTVSSPADSHQSTAGENAKRKAGRSLDDTVRKLSEKRKAELEEQPPLPTVAPYQAPSLDPQSYLNMIRIMQTPQSSIFSNVMNQM